MNQNQTFTIYVTPAVTVHRCKAYQAEESQGLYGFHNYRDCPDCVCEINGWELWGENGHLQGSCKTPGQLSHRIHVYRRPGMREIFVPAGGIAYYVGRNL